MNQRRPGNLAHEHARAAAAATHDAGRGVVDEVASRDIELGNIAFVDILGVDLKPEWRGGIIRVAGYITAGLASPQYGNSFRYAYIDVRIVGYVGSKPESICRAAFGSDSGAIDVVLEPMQAYRRIAVLARLVVDGVIGERVLSPAYTDVPRATASAIARFTR